MAIGRLSSGCETGARDDNDIEDESTRGDVGGRGRRRVTTSIGEGKYGDSKTRGIDRTS